MKKLMITAIVIYSIVISAIVNSYILIREERWLLFVAVPLFAVVNCIAGFFLLRSSSKRLKVCCHGTVTLLVFVVSAVISLLFHAVLLVDCIVADGSWISLLWSAVYCICLEAVVFWNGIISVYLTSVQLGIKQRVIGALCGMIPLVNLIALAGIIRATFCEVIFESEKEQTDISRNPKQICRTKYPLLMVHGVFFRDSAKFNYWGRVPAALEKNGAVIYYGEHESASSVADSAQELSERIKEIVEQSGCEKVNIIAHSKGGLDCRYAIAKMDIAQYVASLTTINTPHRGCLFADHLLKTIAPEIKNGVANTYNAALSKLGDKAPDFLTAVGDLTAEACEALNEEIGEAPEGIYCQSVGSILKNARDGQFPLNFSYGIVKQHDGPNDGLASEKAFAWGERYTLLTTGASNGISHGDMIDLNRRNVEGFDVREFYVQLVSDLRSRGL